MNVTQPNEPREGRLSLLDYRLTYRGSDSILEWEYARHLPFRIEWDVVLKEKPHERDVDVGLGIAHYFPVIDALGKGINAVDLFSSVSTDCEAVCEGLFGRRNNALKMSLRERFACDIANPDVLVINAIVLSPDHRGSSLGLAVLKRVIERFAPDIGLVAMAPTFWLPGFWVEDNVEKRWVSPYDGGETPGDPRQTDKLYCHLAKLGFKRVPHSEVLALSTIADLPPMGELCPKLMG